MLQLTLGSYKHRVSKSHIMKFFSYQLADDERALCWASCGTAETWDEKAVSTCCSSDEKTRRVGRLDALQVSSA